MVRRPIQRNVRKLIAQARAVLEAITTKDPTDEVRKVFGVERETELAASIAALRQHANELNKLERSYDTHLATRRTAELQTIALLTTLRTLIKTLHPTNPTAPALYGFDVTNVGGEPGDRGNGGGNEEPPPPTTSTQAVIEFNDDTYNIATTSTASYTIVPDPTDNRPTKWPEGTEITITITNNGTEIDGETIENPTSPITRTIDVTNANAGTLRIDVTVEEPGLTPVTTFATTTLTNEEPPPPDEYDVEWIDDDTPLINDNIVVTIIGHHRINGNRTTWPFTPTATHEWNPDGYTSGPQPLDTNPTYTGQIPLTLVNAPEGTNILRVTITTPTNQTFTHDFAYEKPTAPPPPPPTPVPTLNINNWSNTSSVEENLNPHTLPNGYSYYDFYASPPYADFYITDMYAADYPFDIVLNVETNTPRTLRVQSQSMGSTVKLYAVATNGTETEIAQLPPNLAPPTNYQIPQGTKRIRWKTASSEPTSYESIRLYHIELI